MKKIKSKLVNFVVRNVFKGVTTVDFLRIVKGNIYQNGKMLPDDVKESYIRNSNILLDDTLNKQIDNEIRRQAELMLFNESNSNDDMIFPKAVLWYIQKRNEKLKEISKLK